jgi:CBS domain-containing protein
MTEDVPRPGSTSVSTLIGAPVAGVAPDASVHEVAERMMECYIRHVLVEAGGRLIGIVSARDLLGDYVSSSVDIDQE